MYHRLTISSGFYKRTDSCFQRWQERGIGGRRVSGEVLCSSAQGVGAKSFESPLLGEPDKDWAQLPHGDPPVPGLQHMLRLFAFPVLTPPPQGLSTRTAGMGPSRQSPHQDGHSRHSLSNGNRWAAAAFSLLVLGHLGFCSSSASRFWGQEAARMLAAFA